MEDQKHIFVRTFSQESEKAEQIIKAKGIEFKVIFGEKGELPILLAPRLFPGFKGVNEIRSYLNTIPDKREKVLVGQS